MEYRAALLASRGYATLALAYIGHKDLPAPPNRMNVGTSYFRVGCWQGFYSLFLRYKYDPFCHCLKINICSCCFITQSAFHLLQDHPQVQADRVGIIGLSFGVYLSLRTATQTDVNVSLSPLSICQTRAYHPLGDALNLCTTLNVN